MPVGAFRTKKHYMMTAQKSRENYTRVTSILYPFSGLEKIDAKIVAHAAERGTKVHRICESIVSGLGEHGVEDETRGYVESFKQWFSSGIDVVRMEERFWDDEFCFTGQIDFILRMPDGSLAVADLKTSYKPSKTWQAQGCAYAYLAKKAGFDITRIIFVHLHKTGKAPTLYEYPVDDQFFFNIYHTYKHFYHKESHG